jgi:3-phosphoshikimate 1-carboxyvinyltransferase
MFAALQAKGETSIKERVSGRDHTEKLFCHLNLPINFEDAIIKVRGSCKPSGLHRFNVPGDISSAAFLVTAATIIDGSRLLIKDVCLNPTRTGFIKVLRRMGANIETTEGERVWEPRGDILVNSAKLKATEIMPDEIPHLIDELPILATAMAFAEGTSRVFGAGELRHKETDRIRDLVIQINLAGIHCRELTDGFEITGPSQIKHQASLDSFGDHRLAMSFAVLALNSEQGLTIKGADSIAISFPKFFTTLHSCIQQKN